VKRSYSSFAIYSVLSGVEGLPLVMKLSEEGYDAILVLMDEEAAFPDKPPPGKSFFEPLRRKLYPLVGEGLVRKVPADLYEPTKDTIIIFDFNYGFNYAEILMRKCPGIYSFEWAYELEHNRAKSAEFVKKYYPDLYTPEEVDFPPNSLKDIYRFIVDSEDFWVIKPDSDAVHTFVPDVYERKAYLSAVEHYLLSDKDILNKTRIQLQRKIVGYECVVETWYRQGIPIMSNVDLELKNLFAGDLRPQVGCAADLVFTIPLDSYLRKIANAPFDAIARKLYFTGVMDADIIFEAKSGKPYFLEFCPGRFGYNAIFTLLDRYRGYVGDFFRWAIIGRPHPPVDRTLYGASVRIFDYNHYYYLGEERPRRLSIPEHCNTWLWDVMKKDGLLYVVGSNMNILVITSSASTPDQALKAVKLYAREVSFDTPMWRYDIDSEEGNWSILNRLRYIRGLGARKRIGFTIGAKGVQEVLMEEQ